MTDTLLGIDLGGTYVKIGLCSPEGRVVASTSIPTEAARGPEDAIDRIGAAVEKLTEKAGRPAACGSGVPGPLDLERRIILTAPNLRWTNVRYPELLSRRLGMPVIMENDANCAAWAEFIAGAGRGTRSLTLYTLGTGIGGGIVLNGELWVGASGAAGELGHMTIDPRGPRCACGRDGCLETYASATAVARRYGKGGAREAFEAARKGDRDALAAIDEAADALAAGVAAVIHVIHPELIVLAGGMAAAGDALFDRVREGVRRRVFPVFLERIRIEPSTLGDDAGWLGAALWGGRKSARGVIREPTATSQR